MPPKRDQQILIDAARMYYLDGLDQGEIGKRLGISRSTVSRVLASARTEGIVQIRINGVDQVKRNPELEAALRDVFGVQEAVVADTVSSTSELTAVAHLGSQYFTERAPQAARVGFSWGLTIGRLIEAIPRLDFANEVSFVPLVGGMPTLDTGRSGNSYMQIVAAKCHTTAHRFDAPAVVESRTTWKALMSESSVQRAVAAAAACDLAFVGIGSFGEHTSQKVLEAMRLNSEEEDAVKRAQPAGDMCSWLFDIDGIPLGPPASERVIGLGPEDLRQIRTVVGLAAGVEKCRGVIGALRTNVLDTIIVDDHLAQAALDLAAGN